MTLLLTNSPTLRLSESNPAAAADDDGDDDDDGDCTC